MNVLQHRANAAVEKLANARTSLEKYEARAEAFAIKQDLEKYLSDHHAIAAFRKAAPENSAGVYQGNLVADHPVFHGRPRRHQNHRPGQAAGRLDGSAKSELPNHRARTLRASD